MSSFLNCAILTPAGQYRITRNCGARLCGNTGKLQFFTKKIPISATLSTFLCSYMQILCYGNSQYMHVLFKILAVA